MKRALAAFFSLWSLVLGLAVMYLGYGTEHAPFWSLVGSPMVAVGLSYLWLTRKSN